MSTEVKKTQKYYLYNFQNCYFGEVLATSIRSARVKFAKKFYGEFTITCDNGDHMKVNL
jgi:hypothetical protein